MNPSIYDFVMDALDKHRGRWPEVARGSGVSKRTIEKIARREIADPGVSHMQKLADYFGYADAFRNEQRKPSAPVTLGKKRRATDCRAEHLQPDRKIA